MNDIALLIAAALTLLFTGYLLGLRDEHNEPNDGTVAQRKRAVRAEQDAHDLRRINRDLEQRNRELVAANRELTGGPGPARANHHGGLTVTTSPAATTTAGVYHLPQPAPQPTSGVQV